MWPFAYEERTSRPLVRWDISKRLSNNYAVIDVRGAVAGASSYCDLGLALPERARDTVRQRQCREYLTRATCIGRDEDCADDMLPALCALGNMGSFIFMSSCGTRRSRTRLWIKFKRPGISQSLFFIPLEGRQGIVSSCPTCDGMSSNNSHVTAPRHGVELAVEDEEDGDRACNWSTNSCDRWTQPSYGHRRHLRRCIALLYKPCRLAFIRPINPRHLILAWMNPGKAPIVRHTFPFFSIGALMSTAVPRR